MVRKTEQIKKATLTHQAERVEDQAQQQGPVGLLHVGVAGVERLVHFFFSSRRRHTRSLCDWSSDVCSSDLPGCPPRTPRTRRSGAARAEPPGRAEERRVGKECRSRRPPYQQKKKTEGEA